MNDFTKEELTVLQQAFKGACKAFANDEFDATLESKIQHMIDSYCEQGRLKKQITKAIDACKQYGTKESQLIIFAYQNVLRWMASNE